MSGNGAREVCRQLACLCTSDRWVPLFLASALDVSTSAFAEHATSLKTSRVLELQNPRMKRMARHSGRCRRTVPLIGKERQPCMRSLGHCTGHATEEDDF